MSNKIEKRTVEMRFDNAQYEKGIAQSIKSTKDFEKTLQMDGASKGLENVQNGINDLDFNQANTGISSMASGFSVFKTIAIGALLSVGNQVAQLATQMINTVFVEPKKQGFAEYEMRIDSTRVMLNAISESGKGLPEVNAALDELNTYADQTNYNFAQMTDAAGKFALTTGDLEGSITKVKGFSNLAAETGATNANLQGTMYQLSQVSGAVRAMDWMSVRNNNMASKAFQDDLIARAKEMGTISQETVALLESGAAFQTTLETEWLTTDVLDSVVAEYANDEEMTRKAGEVGTFTKMMSTIGEEIASGWSTTFGYIIGDYEQSLEFFTGLKNAIVDLIMPMHDARNEMLKFWNENGGRAALLEGLANIFGSLVQIIKTVQEAFRDVFPATTGEEAVALTEKFRDFSEIFKISEENLKRFKDVLTAVFYVIKIGLDIIFALVGGLNSIATSIVNLIKMWASLVIDFWSGFIGIEEAAGIALSPLERVAKIIWDISKGISGFIDGITNFINVDSKKAGEATGSIFESIGEGFISMLNGLPEFASRVVDTLITVLTGGLLVYITKIAKSGADLSKGITDILEGIVGVLEGAQQNLKSKAIANLASSILTLAIAVGILALIPHDRLWPAIGAMSALMTVLLIFSNNAKTESIVKLPALLMSLGVTMLLLAFSLRVIADIYEQYGWEALTVAGIAIAALGVGIFFMTKYIKNTDLTGLAAGLMGMAAAIYILALALSIISVIEPSRLEAALESIGAMMLGMILFAIIGNQMRPQTLVKASSALIVVATAVGILAGALLVFGWVQWEALAKAGVALLGILATMAIAATISKKISSGYAPMIAMSFLLTTLANSLLIFGLVQPDSITKAAMALVTVMSLLLGFATLMTFIPGIAPVMMTLGISIALMGHGLLLGATALLIFVGALGALGAAGPIAAVGLTTILGVFILFIDDLIRSIGNGIITILEVITKSSKAIEDAFVAVILAVVGAVNKTVRPVTDMLLNFIYVLLDELSNHIGPIVEVLVELLVEITKAALTELGKLVNNLFGLAWGGSEMTQAQKDLIALREETNKLIDANNELEDSILDASEARKESLESMETNEAYIDELTERILEFANQESLSNAEIEIMKGLINDLNGEVVDLGLAWDDEAGKLNMNTEELKKNINERINLMNISAYEDVMQETFKAYIDLDFDTDQLYAQRGEIQTEIDNIQAKLDSLGFTEPPTLSDWIYNEESAKQYTDLSLQLHDTQTQFNDLTTQINDSEASLEGLNDEYKNYTYDLAVLNGESEENARKIAEQVSLVPDSVIQTMNELFYAYQDALSKSGGNVDTAISLLKQQITDGTIKINSDLTQLGTEGIAAYTELFGDEFTLQQVLSATGLFGDQVILGLNKTAELTPSSGQNAIEGFLQPINNPTNWQRVFNAGVNIANQIIAGIKAGGDENSPWKTTTKSGIFAVEGLIGGMQSMRGKASQAAKSLVNTILEPADDIKLNTPGFESLENPVIRPILDLENVYEGLNVLSNMFNGIEPMLTSDLAASIDSNVKTNQNGNTSGEATAIAPNNVTFNQYNTSPKSLSTTDIYRKTKSIVRKGGV